MIEEDGMIETCVWIASHFFCPQCQTCLFTLICKFVQYEFAENFENYPTSYKILYQDSDLERSNCFIDKDGKLVKPLLHL